MKNKGASRLKKANAIIIPHPQLQLCYYNHFLCLHYSFEMRWNQIWLERLSLLLRPIPNEWLTTCRARNFGPTCRIISMADSREWPSLHPLACHQWNVSDSSDFQLDMLMELWKIDETQHLKVEQVMALREETQWNSLLSHFLALSWKEWAQSYPLWYQVEKQRCIHEKIYYTLYKSQGYIT